MADKNWDQKEHNPSWEADICSPAQEIPQRSKESSLTYYRLVFHTQKVASHTEFRNTYTIYGPTTYGPALTHSLKLKPQQRHETFR
jgi:hypothetical protein